jgi:hypothetical protein
MRYILHIDNDGATLFRPGRANWYRSADVCAVAAMWYRESVIANMRKTAVIEDVRKV